MFAQTGLLSEAIPQYQLRDVQLQMAIKVWKTLQQSSSLVCEAGTGTGKTFAYLVPVFLSGQQTIISTGTRNLQDQLYDKDLPLISKVLEPLIERTVSISLLKGRTNYVCLYRLNQAEKESWYDEQTQADLQTLKKYHTQTRYADRAEFTMLEEQSSVWSIVTSSTDNCLGAHCPDYEHCYVLKAREQALSADIVIVNHHLLMADLNLKKDALGEILPTAVNYIIDEAHQLPEIASRFFSRRISSQQIKDLLQDVRKELKAQPSSGESFKHLNQDIRRLLDDLTLVLSRYKQRGNWLDIQSAIKPMVDEVTYVLNKLATLLTTLAPVNQVLEHFAQRAELLLAAFNQLTFYKTRDEAQDETKDKQRKTDITNNIHWFECRNNGFEINSTPLLIGEQFRAQVEPLNAAWVFTSASLTINDSAIANINASSDTKLASQFNYFATQLGLNQADFARYDSPFNYARQSVIYAPQNMPMPGEPHYTRTLIKTIIPLIHWLKGRTFLLFTSYRAMREAHQLLSDSGFILLVQGDAPKRQLINQFKQTKNSVLLGTSSFWEGVDVKGDALSCVVLDKLPFASPGEPVLEARIDYLQQQGINAFYQLQLPQAAMALKQGAGRLIRDINDTGILVLADPRLFNKSYGRYLRNSLPDMPVENKFELLQHHFTKLKYNTG